MDFGFEFVDRPTWPKLAWLAELRSGASSARVHLGDGVERTDEWFCEAVWDGRFADANFDQTDIVAGSGGRVRPDKLVFVSSGSTLDRLVHLRRGDEVMVSNSFVALTAWAELPIDPTRTDFTGFLASIIQGRSSYERAIAFGSDAVEATYVDNLVWDGRELRVRPKPLPIRDFSTFDSYAGFLEGTASAILENAHALERRLPLEPLVPMSSGYDSSAVAVLARKAGATDAMCILSDRDGLNDSAERLARQLGYRLTTLKRDEWQNLDVPEVGCLAGSGGAGEVAMLGRPALLSGRVLMTGFHGDAVWSLEQAYLSEDWRRKDGSGLCLTEPRLHLGFLHCGVCFWGLAQARDIYAISVSAAMGPWDLGVKYSRPIPRRLVEDAGVPREWFGMKKRGVSDSLLQVGHPLSPGSQKAFDAWARRHATAWIARGRLPPVAAFRAIDEVWRLRVVAPNLRRASRALARLGLHGASMKCRKWAVSLVRDLSGPRRYYVTWSLMEAVKSYRTG